MSKAYVWIDKTGRSPFLEHSAFGLQVLWALCRVCLRASATERGFLDKPRSCFSAPRVPTRQPRAPACLLMARVFSVPSRTLPQGSVIYFPPPTCELAHHNHFPTRPPEGDPPHTHTHTPHSHSLGIPEGTAALGWCSNTFFLSDRKEGKSTGGRERGRRGSRALVQLVLESAKFTLLSTSCCVTLREPSKVSGPPSPAASRKVR